MRAALGRKTWGTAAALVGVALFAVAGCSSGSASSSGDRGFAAASAAAEPAAAPSAPGLAESATAGAAGSGAAAGDVVAGAASSGDGAGGAAAGAAGSAASGSSPGSSGQLPTLPVDGSKVIKTANLTVRLVVAPVPGTDDAAADSAANATARSDAAAKAAASVRTIALTAGGFQAGADGSGSQVTITLRVPNDQYDSVVDKLVALGELTTRSESSQDVTAEVVDVKSRVDSMTASVARVRALLAQASSIADIISIESELSVREANLESLQQQQAFLDGQVAMSTIALTMTAVTDDPRAAAAPASDSGFVAGITAGWAALLGFLGWAGGVIGAVLPFLPFIAAAGVLIWWLLRRARRRPASSATTGPAPDSTPGGQQPAGAPAQEEGRSVGVGSG